jgi:hypothetical protein
MSRTGARTVTILGVDEAVDGGQGQLDFAS